MSTGSVSRSISIDASPEVVFGLVSDLPNMGRLSPENTGGSWVGGATGPAVGARFKGRNANGKRRWRTAVKVVECDPGKAFAFAVSSTGMSVSTWSYAIAAEGSGCQVTETWLDQRNGLIKVAGRLLTGVEDREDWTGESIEKTLAALKQHAEGQV